ncbi:MAG: PTS sugar transporter subunit IIA [Myxococcota bacterium]
MRIVDFLQAEDIVPEMRGTEKLSALAELAESMARRHGVDAKAALGVLLDREKLASTGIGDGVAIPHGKLAGAPGLCAALARSRPGVPFDSVDGRAAHLFFALIAPESSTGLHLKALARISRLVKDAGFRHRLLEASDAAQMYRMLLEEDGKL